MPPSRRTVVSAVGTALALGSGCSALGDSDAEPTASAPIESFEVELQGPETSRTLFDETGVASVGQITDRSEGVGLPITLTDEARTTTSEQFRSAGVAENPDEFELVERYDGTTKRVDISPSLADSIAAGEWDGQLLLTFEDRAVAANIRAGLRSA